MASLQELKKKYRGIQSTQKLTKAMKTVSAAKYSSLNRAYSGFSSYSRACISLYEKYTNELNSVLPSVLPSAPPAVFVFSSNKGMCGGFNTEIFALLNEKANTFAENTVFFPCGKKAIAHFTEKNIPFTKEFVFSDIPTSEECENFLGEILKMRTDGKISSVHFIYPEYKNVIKQIPVIQELFTVSSITSEDSTEDTLFVPDKDSVIKAIAEKILFTTVFSVMLQTALGSQAATLTTMRSAYDTAVKYSGMLEIQINRKRQSEVTADVLETSSL